MEKIEKIFITNSEEEIQTLTEALHEATRSTDREIKHLECLLKSAQDLEQVRQYQARIKELTKKRNRYNMYYMQYRLI